MSAQATERSREPGSAPRRARVDERLARRGGWIELLRAPALVFGLIARLRGAAYDLGVARAHRLDVPVISVGNLSVGGTGKTPMVVWLARKLLRRGLRPGILSRGFGPSTGRAGDGVRGDEAAVIVAQVPDAPHHQDPDRVRGGRELARRGLDAILLDDGFQHRRLARDLDLVLVDATRPWGLPTPPGGGPPVRALLPRGLLREPPSALARADAVILTRADEVEPAELDRLRGEIAELAPALPILEAVHWPIAVHDPDGWRLSTEVLRGREVELASGIGNPASFEATVARLGASIVRHHRFPDHHAWSPGDLEGPGDGQRMLVTTQKDAAKLAGIARKAWVVEVEIRLRAGEPVLEALLDALPESRAARERNAIHEGLHG